MKNYIAMSLVLVLFALSSAANGGDDAKADSKKIQGTWKVVKAQVDGKEVDAALTKGTQFIFKGDIITFDSPREKNSATFKLDASKKPHRIDTEVLDGKAKGDARLGIYELSGDTLKLCWSRSTTRPSSFTTKEGDKFINLELERVKD